MDTQGPVLGTGAPFETNVVQCPFCYSQNLHSFVANVHDDVSKIAKIQVTECSHCQTAWQWPPSTQDSLGYFEKQYTRRREGSYFDPKAREAVAKLEMDFVDSLTTKPVTILDVGAGAGYFVEEARRRGWEATGVEPSAVGVAQFAERTGENALRVGTMRSLDCEATFDVITLWDVVEHLERPLEVLEEARRRLRPGGGLVVETGNYLSAARVEAGKDWWGYKHDHLWFFSPVSLEKLLRRAGFAKLLWADEVLRPSWNGVRAHTSSTLRYHLLRGLTTWRVLDEIGKYVALRRLGNRWPRWSWQSIFTVAAFADGAH